MEEVRRGWRYTSFYLLLFLLPLSSSSSSYPRLASSSSHPLSFRAYHLAGAVKGLYLSYFFFHSSTSLQRTHTPPTGAFICFSRIDALAMPYLLQMGGMGEQTRQR